MNGHPARLPDHLLAGASQLIQVAAFVADGRVHRRDLIDLAGVMGELGTDLVGGHAGGVGSCDDHSLGIARVTSLSEADDAVVRLRLRVEVVHEACRTSDADREQTCRRGVERPGVADPSLTKDASHLADGVEGGDSGGFVERENGSSARDRRPRTRAGPGRCDAGHPAGSINRRATSSTLRSAAGSESANSAPAARRWPPPPNGVQTSVASMGSRVRTLILVRPEELLLEEDRDLHGGDALERIDDALGVLQVRSCLLSIEQVTSDQRRRPSISERIARPPCPRDEPGRGSATCSS